MTETDPRSAFSPLEVADTIGQLGSAMSAIHREVLRWVVVADERGDWREDGAHDMAGWLCARLGLRSASAAEWVRVAHALERLPECARGYAEGRLTWDQLRPLTEFATPEREAEQAASAAGSSAAFLEAVARRSRTVSREQAQCAHERRSVRMWTRDGEFRMGVRLPVEAGAVVQTALERIVHRRAEENPKAAREAHGAQLADSLTELASGGLAADPDADRATVVVHVDAAALVGPGEGPAQLDGEVPAHVEVARRLACDGRLEIVAEGPDGRPVGVGRARRTIPAWLWRLVKRRDGGRCRFPGCNHRGWLQGHHIRWWSRGGRTDLDNLLTVCGSCHRLLHELGWTVEGSAGGGLTFRRPDGRALANGPPALEPWVRERLTGSQWPSEVGSGTNSVMPAGARRQATAGRRSDRGTTTSRRSRPDPHGRAFSQHERRGYHGASAR
jgi:hypothetical protein